MSVDESVFGKDQAQQSGKRHRARANAPNRPAPAPTTKTVDDEYFDFVTSMTSPRPTAREQRWQRKYRHTLVTLDAGIALFSALVAFMARFGLNATPDEISIYLLLTAIFPVAWATSMLFCRTYEHRFLGVGSEEYRRVIVSGLIVSSVISTASYAMKLELARGFVLLALPLATILTVICRYVARKQLHRVRQRGQCMSRVIVVGHVSGVEALVRQVRTTPYHGLDIIGACTPTGEDPEAYLSQRDVPVLGSFDNVVEAVKQTGADAVAVMPCPEMDGPTMRKLGWSLEATAADMLVAPAVVEVVGPRIHIRPVCGLPLLHVERPELEGAHRWAKGTFDRVSSMGALLVLAPLFIFFALAIRLTSSGPALFKQVRVGRNGREFTMYKFRTMVVNADKMVDNLQDQSQGNGVLFKMKQDPRITKIGGFLRKYSLDELPQLLNVAKGEMSLVGPRPPLPEEIVHYGDDMRRRLLVKPGLTGLWQINGRSDLSWDESVRLDLRYVENWSFAFDFMIIWKTIGAVLAKKGAY